MTPFQHFVQSLLDGEITIYTSPYDIQDDKSDKYYEQGKIYDETMANFYQLYLKYSKDLNDKYADIFKFCIIFKKDA